MTDNKPTDKEIIKALECCNKESAKACSECPYHQYCPACLTMRNRDTINLINRLQAENEQLEKDKERLAISYANAVARNLTIKADAIKEFAERLKENAYLTDHKVYAVLRDDVDNLVKEMVGEE